ncbi:hypothetical protein ABT354_19770 [Streptomyces sp. NPDC000594]|uniref:hypothetical protein n=1 Tax=Streptomyces sp. NPDC000594 TaxID=3154261 RepID=UPI00331F4F00
MPKGSAAPLVDRDTTPIVRRIRKRLAEAGDGDLELFPAPEDVYGVLVYVREHESLLEKPVERLEALRKRTEKEEERLTAARVALQEHALDRVLLIRRMRQLLDVQEAAVLDACTRAKITGQTVAKAMGLESRGGPALRRERLRLAIASGWEVRTPRIAKEREQQEAKEREEVVSGHARVREVALNLLSHRPAFIEVEDLDEWWDDLQWYLDGNDSDSLAQASVLTHLRLIVRDLRTQSILASMPPSADARALQSLAEAEAVTKW